MNVKKNKTRVIDTRSASKNNTLVDLLREKGYDAVSLPMIRTKTIHPGTSDEMAMKNMHQFDHLVFTSPRGAASFMEIVQKNKLEDPFREGLKVSVIGNGTARACRELEIPVFAINPGKTSEDFAPFLKQKVIKKDERVLLALGTKAPDGLKNELSVFADARRINVYQTEGIHYDDKDLLEALEGRSKNVLVFSSPSAFQHLKSYKIGKIMIEKAKIAAFGPITAKSIENDETKVDLVASKPDSVIFANEIDLYLKK